MKAMPKRFKDEYMSLPYMCDIAAASEASGIDWKSLSGKNVLVAGAGGIIGSAVVDAVMSSCSTASVYAISTSRGIEYARNRFFAYADDERFHIIEADLSEKKSIDALVSVGVRFDIVISAAGRPRPDLYETIPVGTLLLEMDCVRNLSAAALISTESCGGNGLDEPARLVYVSSCDVYGAASDRPEFREGMPFFPFKENDVYLTDPNSYKYEYALGKRAAEVCALNPIQSAGMMAEQAEHVCTKNMTSVVVRPCHTYGPFFKEDDDRFASQVLREAAANREVAVITPDTVRHWLYTVDCAMGILLAATKGEKWEIYNLAGAPAKMGRFASIAISAANAGISEREVNPPTEEKAGGPYVNTDKIGRIGWKELCGLDRGLHSSVATISEFGEFERSKETSKW